MSFYSQLIEDPKQAAQWTFAHSGNFEPVFNSVAAAVGAVTPGVGQNAPTDMAAYINLFKEATEELIVLATKNNPSKQEITPNTTTASEVLCGLWTEPVPFLLGFGGIGSQYYPSSRMYKDVSSFLRDYLFH
jgi:hypothetical protein